MLNRQVGTHEPYTFTEHEVADMAKRSGLNPKVVQHAQARGLAFFPGVMTPTDVELALDLGCLLQKFFPASVAGGLEMIKALAAPYGHTGLNLIPLGGITAQNMADYLAHPLVLQVVAAARH